MTAMQKLALCCLVGMGGCWSRCAPAAGGDEGLGGWNVTVDQSGDLLQSMRAAFAGAGAVAAVDGVTFNITRNNQEVLEEGTKQSMIGHWEEAIETTIQTGEGSFGKLSSDDVRAAIGIPLDQWREKIIEAQPYGRRDFARSHIGREILVLADKYPSMCDDDTGAMAAFIAAYYPTPGVQNDFGSITVILLGVGRCGPDNYRAVQLLSKTKEEVIDDFVKNVGDEW